MEIRGNPKKKPGFHCIRYEARLRKLIEKTGLIHVIKADCVAIWLWPRVFARERQRWALVVTTFDFMCLCLVQGLILAEFG